MLLTSRRIAAAAFPAAGVFLKKPAKFGDRDRKQLPVPLSKGGEFWFGGLGEGLLLGGEVAPLQAPFPFQVGLQLDTGGCSRCLTLGTSQGRAATAGSAPNKANAFACLAFFVFFPLFFFFFFFKEPLKFPRGVTERERW